MINKIIELLKKYREQISYLFFGCLTTLISWGVSTVLYYFVFGESGNLLSNIISEAIAITFAYVTNKLFVFNSKTPDFASFMRELLSFFGLRVISTFLNLGAMYLLVDVWKAEFWICKIAVNVIIIVVNYVFSKLLIFNKSKNVKTEDKDE